MADASDPGDVPRGAAFRDIPVTLTVSVGHVKTTIGDLLSLEHDAVVPLDARLEDPLVIYAGEKIVGYGELQESGDGAEGALSLRITKLVAGGDGD